MKKNLILTFIVLSFFNPEAYARTAKAITAGYSHTCAIELQGVRCWGDNEFHQTDVPPLTNPRMISAGAYFNCAIDDKGAHCWGDNEFGQTDMPNLRNPKIISAGENYACAIDDKGAHCWGDNEHGQTNVPELHKPKAIFAGAKHTCAIDDSGVKCWGNNDDGQITIPELTNPKTLSLGSSHTCALDDDGVTCWGSDQFGEMGVPELSHPKALATNGSYNTAIDDFGVHTWGFGVSENDTDVQADVPEMHNPKMATVGLGHACAIDDSGIVCWGSNSIGQSDSTFLPQLDIAKYGKKSAKLIPVGSVFKFTEDILIEVGKREIAIGTKAGNVLRCSLLVESDDDNERVVKAGKEFEILGNELIKEKTENELIFNLNETSTTISCTFPYTSIITIEDVINSLKNYGVELYSFNPKAPKEL